MQPNAEGFLYPAIDPEACVDCGLCERRCPATRAQARGAHPAYAARTDDEAVREASSSGGIFTQLARGVLRRGGVVFGAAMDEELRVSHVGVMDETALGALRGSKYVQSDVDDAYHQATRLLDAGVPVLFLGSALRDRRIICGAGWRPGKPADGGHRVSRDALACGVRRLRQNA